MEDREREREREIEGETERERFDSVKGRLSIERLKKRITSPGFSNRVEGLRKNTTFNPVSIVIHLVH